MKLRPVLRGLSTYVPGIERILPKRRTGGTNTALYCYEVWMKHLVLLWSNGLRSIPAVVAELGPGDSIGTGLAAMLSGVDHYYALDMVKYADTETNRRMLDELVELFKSRTGKSVPSWPEYEEHLDENLFPSQILTDNVLRASLSDERISLIRDAIVHGSTGNEAVTIDYMVPWSEQGIIEQETVDVLFSHAVLEHINDLDGAYRNCFSWLKPGGMMSHQIGLTSHGISEKWNGYWAYSERLWKIIMGRRPYLINRQPISVHIDLMRKNGFEIVCDLRKYRTDGIERSQLSEFWADISDDDLTCSDAFVQVRKRQSGAPA